MTTEVQQTLAERGDRYGRFADNAALSQRLQEAVRTTNGSQWPLMPLDCREAITFILQKIARICNGDPEYTDNWHDIQGYAKLVEDRILEQQSERTVEPGLDDAHASSYEERFYENAGNLGRSSRS